MDLREKLDDKLIINKVNKALTKASDAALKVGIQTGIEAAFKYLGDCVDATGTGALVVTRDAVNIYEENMKKANVVIKESSVQTVNKGENNAEGIKKD